SESYSSKLTIEAKKRTKEEQSEMIRSLDRLVKIVGIVIIPIAVILFWQQYKIAGQPLRSSVTATVAAILGMIPEGLYLLASVAMAVSAMRLAMTRVLIHNMKSIETLARADVLCVDKTGTITENNMTVKEVIPIRVPLTAFSSPARITDQAGQAADTAAAGGMQAGNPALSRTQAAENTADPGQGDQADAGSAVNTGFRDQPQSAYESQTSARGGFGPEVYPGFGPAAAEDAQDGEEIVDSYAMEDTAALELTIGDFAASMGNDNITMKAIKTRFTKQTGRRPERIFPFSPMYKYSAAVFGRNQYVLGAPEFILRSDYPIYAQQIEKYTMVGYRVLVFALYQGELTGEALTAGVLPMGLILLTNPVRQGAAEPFRYFERQGVTVKVISGDNPMTVSEVAMEAGIPGAEHYVDASALDEEDMQAAVKEYTVFGRVTPQQKRQLINALTKNGHTVAMTGDGVNDVLALKDADCSIAMASGSDAAAHAAQMVLLESDFSKMPAVVSEGRRVVNNIERTASLFLVKNIFSLLLSVFSIIFMLNYPLEPSQISLIGMFTIGIPAFVMSLETNTGQIRGHFLSNVFFRSLPAGLTDFIIISALVIFCREFRVSGTDLSTSATVLLAIVGIMILYRIASPMTRLHWILWISMICGLLICMVFMNQIFAIHALSRKSGMLLVIFAIVTEPLLRYLSLVIRKIWQLVGWIRGKLKERALAQEKLFAEMQ
ncbi:MAG: HAD-IC family P-type ATPase, partial [Lachnospiraceae bacterium]|nr:HAD-IC family P-type ATPase [Lachnospiraceae bacterium]